MECIKCKNIIKLSDSHTLVIDSEVHFICASCYQLLFGSWL